MDDESTLDDVPVAFRRMILMRWLAQSPSWTTDTSTHGTKYLLNDDFGVDFEEPEEEVLRRKAMEEIRASAGSNPHLEIDMQRNQQLIHLKAELVCNLFEGMCADRRVVCIVDDALHLDSSSWFVASHLGKYGGDFGKGLGVVLASRPVTDFVLIDANSRDSYLSFQKLPGVKRLKVPELPPRFVRQLAIEIMKVDVIAPDIEIALEKAQGNPLFVRELAQSMADTPDVLDIDQKNRVATFGKAAQMKLNRKEDYPSCQSCGDRFHRSRDKQHCRMCGQVVCEKCAPANNKRVALGYTEPVRCCIKCASDSARNRRVTIEAIEAMKLEPPVAIVCVIGTWIDKLTTKQQMVLKVACLLRQELRFEKSKAFDAYPLDRAGASFELEFDALVQLGFVRAVIDEDKDGPQGIFGGEDDLYEFCHNFLPDVLNQRVLESQRDELQNHVNEARQKREEQDRMDFMSSKGTKLSQMTLKEGYLMVHKTNISSNRKPWKQRWAVIVGHRIEFYYDRGQKTCAAACDLRHAKVFIEKNELSSRKRVIKIAVPSWEKRGKVIEEKRDFFVSPELGTDQERDQWIYFLNVAIEANAFENGRAKRGTSVTGWFRSKGPLALKSASKQPVFANPATNGTPPHHSGDYQTSSDAIPSTPRKSRGLELILGRKKTSSSLGHDNSGAPPPPLLAAYQEDK